MQERILILGLGELGSRILGQLLALPDQPEVWIGSRTRQTAIPRRNTAVCTARQLGFHDAWAEWIETDVTDIERTAETIARISPSLVVNATTLQSWWVINELPPEAFKRLDAAQVGPWLPMHLVLTRSIAEAMAIAGLGSSALVNCSFPDIVNVVLGKLGLAPLTGIGNIANNEPALTHLVARAAGVSSSRVFINMVLHHYVSHRISRCGDSGGAPYHLSAYIDDEPYEVDPTALIASLPTYYKRLGGAAGQSVTAASAVRIVRGLLSRFPSRSHAPGVQGLPGGYPVRLCDHSISLELPASLSISEAVAINEAANPHEGIEQILDDGTVIFVDEHVELMERELGYFCKSLPPDTAPARAEELVVKYKAHAERVCYSILAR